MTERLEQRYCIRFCQKLCYTQVEIIRKFQQAFGDDAMSITRINEWYNHFKDGSTSVGSEPRHGRASTSRNGSHQPCADFGHAGPSYPYPRAGRRGRGKHWIGTYYFDFGFGLEDSVREIRAEAAKDGAEAASPGYRTRHAGLRRK